MKGEKFMKFVGIFTLLILMNTNLSFAQNASSSGTDVVYLSQEENQFYLLLNQFRSQLGLPTLQIHVFLQNAAKKHSAWMAQQDFLTHYGPENNETPFQRMADEGYINYTYAGENVACGNGDAVKTFRQWLFSPDHLANILNPHFHHMGISRAGTGNEQCPYYWTNDFGSVSDVSKDPASITDLQRISNAVANVTGTIPAGKSVQLPAEQRPADNNGNTVPPTPPVQNSFSVIQCMIPYSISKNVLSFIPNTDALLEVSANNFGGYQGKVSYLQNGASTSLQPFIINNMSVEKNANYPLYLIFSAPAYRMNGFTIQLDTSKNQAQFDTYPASASSSGSVLCTIKY